MALRRFIIVCGRQYAGKTTLARAISRCLLLPVIELGEYVAALAGDERYIHRVADRHFRSGSAVTFAQAAILDAQVDGASILVGPRKPEELELLREQSEGSFAIGITCSADERFKRWQDATPRKDHVPTADVWRERDAFETDWGIDATLARCDVLFEGVGYKSGELAKAVDIIRQQHIT